MTPTAPHDLRMVQAAPPIPAPGLRGAFRLLLEHLGDHLDLLRLETAQELSRLGAVLGCWFVLALTIQLALILGLAVLNATLWNTEYRMLAVIGSAALLLALMLFCCLQLRRLGAEAGQRFTASSQQWQRDLELIREII